MTIRVFQGEREMAADNKILGQFDLVGIPPAPRGVPQVEVTFDIDANGIVNVSAKDKATDKEQQIRIQASGGLSEADIEKMVKDAEAHAEEDKKRKAAVEAKNHGEALVHSTEKALSEHGSKVGDAERTAIENAIADLKEALKGDDSSAIQAKTNTLAQASMKLGEAMYKQSGRRSSPPASQRDGDRCRRQEGRRGRRGIHRSRRRQEQQEIRLTVARAMRRSFAKVATPGPMSGGASLQGPGVAESSTAIRRGELGRYRMSKRDYYEVLGVTRTCDEVELKAAFRKLAMQHHPDRNPGDKRLRAQIQGTQRGL